MSLASKKVLIVGGSSGMGLATAVAAAAAGANLTIAARSEERLRDAARKIGQNVSFRTLDAQNDDSVEDFFGDGAVWNHIVVTVGSGGRGPLPTMSTSDALAAMNAKFWCCFRIARAAKIIPGGSLTFVSGGEGRRGGPGTSLISAINSAIAGLTRGLAFELAPVRVNTMSPGTTDTPLWARMTASDREAMFRRLSETLPARRSGNPKMRHMRFYF
jgi:NAD(P)-dependent dehydrogenase (short-subunit alcohol dehydrogenase family)